MKNRWKALLLAAGLSVGMMTGAVCAGEAQLAAEAMSEAAPAQDTQEASKESAYAAQFESMKAAVAQTLEQLSAMTDEQLTDIMEGTDASNAAIAANWSGVKEELGAYTGVTSSEASEEGDVVTIVSEVEYDAVPAKTHTFVTCVLDYKKNTMSMEWDIQYPKSKLIAEAGLNTLLGMGTVFVVLIFLSFVIGQIHWIPDLLEKRKKKAPAPASVAAPAPAASEETVAEDLSSDEELVAVIAAAIAAAEQTSTDGFVVRSIRKSNRKNWLGA